MLAFNHKKRNKFKEEEIKKNENKSENIRKKERRKKLSLLFHADGNKLFIRKDLI